MSESDPLIGKVLGDYTIIDILGHGGMARVYRGYDPRLDRYAAVKVVTADTDAEHMDEYRVRFSREARAIAHLNHPNIVGVYQFGEVEDEDELYFMAMHFIEGKDLRQILQEYRNKKQLIPPAMAFNIIQDIAAALDHAHANDVIHRDIKPSNIMVTPQGRAILTDFGLALNIPEGTIGTTFGSACYIAPEQAISSADAVPQSDLYSLGVVLYEMFTGTVPFDDPQTMSIAIMHLKEPPPPPRKLNPAISPALEEVIMHALQKAPEDRFPTGAAMVAALREALADDVVLEGPDKDDTDTLRLRARARPEQQPKPEKAPVKTPPKAPASSKEASRHTTKSLPITVKKRRGRFRAWVIIAILLVIAAGGLAALLLQEESASTSEAAAATRPTSTAVPRATTVMIIGTPIPPPRDNADILLLYDEQSFLLVNLTDEPIDVETLSFRRDDPETGEPLTFSASDWENEIAPPSALPGGQCFQVWRMDLNVAPQEMAYNRDYCHVRAAWRITSHVHWFWLNDTPGATFDVILGGETLATCESASGRCEITLP